MLGKPRCSEIAWGHARQDPDGKVKAGLLEPQCPICKGLGLDTAIDIQGPRGTRSAWLRGNTLPGADPPIAGVRTRTRHLTHPERQL